MESLKDLSSCGDWYSSFACPQFSALSLVGSCIAAQSRFVTVNDTSRFAQLFFLLQVVVMLSPMSLCTSASTLLRRSCRLVVDFSVPELGMKGPELLNRATAFPVSLTSRKQNNQRGVGFVTSGHVVAPWLFPKYHNEAMEWLQYVNEDHCTYSLIMDEGAKKIVVQDVRLHKSSDMALLVPEDASLIPTHETLKLRENGLQDDEACTIAGYQVEGDDNREEGCRNEDKRPQLPFVVSGACSAKTPYQMFVITPEPLNYGMCGSPVWDDSGLCVGMVEGIVPPGAPGEFKMLQGHACLIDSPEIEVCVVCLRFLLGFFYSSNIAYYSVTYLVGFYYGFNYRGKSETCR